MYAIIKNGFVISTSDHSPDANDLASRAEIAVEGASRVGDTWDGVQFITPAAPVVKPTTATKLKVIRTLKAQGQWDAIKTALQANPDVEEEWLAAQGLSRNDPILMAFQATLGWSDTQVDELFKAAQ